MEITADLVDRARKYDSAALSEVLAAHYAGVYRMSMGLSGREDVGRGIMRYVMKRSLHAAPKWTQEGAPTRWFNHHTILTARRAKKHRPQPHEDLLVTQAQSAEPAYVAFIRALRALHEQQAEAFILHHGEQLDLRHVSIAMDCSTEATTAHLRAAEHELRKVSGEEYKGFVAEMAVAYASLSPEAALILPRVSRHVSRFVWPRRILRVVGWSIIGAIFALFAWIAWNWKNLVDF